MRGRRRFIFALSENPSKEWIEFFELACRRSNDRGWPPAEIWLGELSIEILLDDRDHVHSYLSERFHEANEWLRLNDAPR